MAVTEMKPPMGGAGWFRYRAAQSNGRTERGKIWAASEREAKVRLAAQGLFALSVDRTSAGRRRYRRGEMAIVFRSLASLVGGGVPLTAALDATRGLARRDLASGLGDVARRVREGRTLATALTEACPGMPRVVVGILEAGEREGRLAGALDESAQQLEFEVELSSTVQSALAYPAVLLAVGLASVIVLGTVVVPKFAALIGDLGQQVPMATRLMLDASLAMQRYWVFGLGLLVACTVASERWVRTDRGRLLMDHVLLRTPMAGRIRLNMASSRVCRSLGATLAAGQPLLGSLDTASIASGDAAVASRLLAVRERVRRGARVSDALTTERALVPIALRLLTIGERAGDLAVMARRAADITSRQVRSEIKTLVGLLEPILVIVLGGMVALCALALLQAVYAVRPGVTP